MAFCSKCGAELAAVAAYCGGCGTGVSTTEDKLPNSASSPDISTQEISDAWKEKFALIEKAGGVKLPKAGELGFRERSKVTFNIWGFLFAPFYYLAKGMWKKAMVLTALSIVIVVVLDAIFGGIGIVDLMTNLVAPVIFATRANIDFYKKSVLGDNNWW